MTVAQPPVPDDDAALGTEPGQYDYRARWDWRLLYWPVGLAAAVTVVVVASGWPFDPTVWLVVVTFGGFLVYSAAQAAHRLRTKAVAFAVDAQGVTLGATDRRDDDVRLSWSEVDAIVRFRLQPHVSSTGDGRYDYVGAMQGDHILHARKVQGWRLDVARLEAATRAYGSGVPVRELPPQHLRDVPL